MSKSLEKAFARSQKKNKQERTLAKLPSKFSAPSMMGAVGALVGFGIGVAVSIVLYLTLIAEVRNQHINELAQRKATIYADYIRHRVEGVKKQLALYADNSGVQAAIEARSAEDKQRYTDRLAKQVNHLIKASLFEPGEAQLSNDFPAIRYSELDMILRAERGEQLRPEAANIENKHVVNFVVRVPQNPDEPLVGSILARFDVQMALEGMNDFLAGSGELVLEQKFAGGRATKILTLGSGVSSAVGEAFVPGTPWSVKFRPSFSLLAAQESSEIHMYGAMGMFTLLLAVLGFSMARRWSMPKVAVVEKAESELAEVIQVPDAPSAVLSQDILDIEIAEEDEDILGLGGEQEVVSEAEPLPEENEEENLIDPAEVPEVVFRAYDIRGVALEQITPQLAQYIGRALGSEALDVQQDTIIVARDARLSSPQLTEWLIRGILSTGCNVLNIGTVPTPLLYFAVESLQESNSGVMVTASHNPGEYNGFKIVMNGKARSGEDIQAIRQRVLKSNFYQGSGQEHRHNIIDDYVDTIFSDVALAGDVSIVIDGANAVTGVVAPKLFEELGCKVTPLYCDLDGSFPNHAPDPSVEENLTDLIEKVKSESADLGVAFDGDGDRIIVVTPSGRIIWPDELIMLFATDILSRNPGADVVFDVKCTRHLASTVTLNGGRPIMWKTGHGPMKDKMRETGALLGGEYSGHIFIKDRWFGFDDAMYAAARLIEIMSLQGDSLDEMFDEFARSPSTPEIRVAVSDEKKFGIIDALQDQAKFGDAKLTMIDGIRADFPDGWGLVRASNTSAELTLRFEADDEESLHKIKSIFVKEIRAIDNTIHINWDQ